MNVLVVEDSLIVADEIAFALEVMGHAVIGPAPSVRRAMNLLRTGEVDAAVLDVHLGTDRVYPVADALAESGRPMIFTTAYAADDLPERFRSWPVLGKPIEPSDLRALLADVRWAEAAAAAMREPVA